MEEWKECKLSDICDYGKDRIEVSSLDNSNYISTENMLPNRAGITIATTLLTGEYTPSFEIDDTLVSNFRPYFKKIWKATFSGGCSADVLVFKAKENVSKEYLYYVLADDEFFKYSMATSKGTKMPRGDKTSIMNYPIKLPPSPHPAKNRRHPLIPRRQNRTKQQNKHQPRTASWGPLQKLVCRLRTIRR